MEADNPAAAVLIDERIAAAARRLLDFPASGRVGRTAGTRERVINGTPYIAAYAVAETTVRSLRVLHGAQEWPENLPLS
ncbi:type II toxin-antitoxin system mRNA interferase toxin, RelE/StbE family [Shinella sp. AETb1-6]|nr:type II toxin-antitoxin system mRNA interferase toxin, RelE/StbE family [Shinella sp. AETb1-6]